VTSQSLRLRHDSHFVGITSGGATPRRARSNDLAGRSTALAPPCLLLCFGNAGRIHSILGVAGQYAISAAIKAIFECQ